MVHRLTWPTVAFGILAGEIRRIMQNALDPERCSTTSSVFRARRE